MIRIADLDNPGCYFWDGNIFNNYEDARKALLSFHDIDCPSEEDREALYNFTLEEICEAFNWEIEEC